MIWASSSALPRHSSPTLLPLVLPANTPLPRRPQRPCPCPCINPSHHGLRAQLLPLRLVGSLPAHLWTGGCLHRLDDTGPQCLPRLRRQ
uniref:Uncharacterized protein n=1 Tax=Triticum urartu TaxID=4572 RepID=A0A8R7TWY0_TRIUA